MQHYKFNRKIKQSTISNEVSQTNKFNWLTLESLNVGYLVAKLTYVFPSD